MTEPPSSRVPQSSDLGDFVRRRILELLEPEDPRVQEEDRARVHCAWSLLDELATQCSLDGARIPGKGSGVEHILKELDRALDREREAGLQRPSRRTWPPMKRLLSLLPPKRPAPQPHEWREAARIAATMAQAIERGSSQEIVSRITEIVAADEGGTHDLDELCECWVTHLRWLGHRLMYVRRAVLEGGEDGLLDRLAAYPEEVRPFLAVAAIKGIAGDESPPERCALSDDEIRTVHAELGGRLGEAVLLGERVDARDAEAAAFLARERLERTLAVGQFAQPQTHFAIHDPLVVLDHQGEASRHQTRLVDGYPHLPSRGRWADWWRKSADVMERDEDSRRALDVALRHHQISCTAPTVGARIVNLWTAFEALFADGTQATSVSVADTVSRMITAQYVRYSMRRLAVQLARSSRVRAGVRAALEPMRGVYSEDDVAIPPQALALVMASPKKTGPINALYGAVTDDPLLVRRVTRHRRSMLTPKALRDRLSHHRATIVWQLHRIYRLRNSVVHGRASFPPRVAQPLLRHALHYLSLALHQIMYGLGTTVDASLRTVVSRNRAMFDFVLDGLNEDLLVGSMSYAALTKPMWWWRGAPGDDLGLWKAAEGALTSVGK